MSLYTIKHNFIQDEYLLDTVKDVILDTFENTKEGIINSKNDIYRSMPDSIHLLHIKDLILDHIDNSVRINHDINYPYAMIMNRLSMGEKISMHFDPEPVVPNDHVYTFTRFNIMIQESDSGSIMKIENRSVYDYNKGDLLCFPPCEYLHGVSRNNSEKQRLTLSYGFFLY